MAEKTLSTLDLSMVNIYINLIKKGKKTINDVPVRLQEEVRKKL